jgi:DNA-3-methyladenine glycosylase
VLGPDFFARSALTVARELLGKFLVRRIDGETRTAIIHETEAYIGPHDLACHASRGRTARTEVMFGPAGYWYVYFIYGIHWMLNVVTSRDGHAAAVLVRGAGPWIGPARLTKALAIDRSLNGEPASPQSGLWVEDRGYRVRRGAIRRTPRIGVDYSGDWAARPYRFVMEPPSEEELRHLLKA